MATYGKDTLEKTDGGNYDWTTQRHRQHWIQDAER